MLSNPEQAIVPVKQSSSDLVHVYYLMRSKLREQLEGQRVDTEFNGHKPFSNAGCRAQEAGSRRSN